MSSSKELVIAANRHETKVALLEDDQLVEVYFQRANEYSLAGSIHKGRVTRVLPGMQSAFVDVGLERDTFLYVSDFFEENEEYDRLPAVSEERPPQGRIPRFEDRADQRAAVEARAAAPPAEGPEASETPAEAVSAETPRFSQERKDDGRRSGRRRRNRGRGFPESKYVSDVNRPSVSEGSVSPVETETNGGVIETRASGAAEEFAVLPGESLAKYRHAGVSSRDPEPEPESIADELPESDEIAAEAGMEPVADVPEPDIPAHILEATVEVEATAEGSGEEAALPEPEPERAAEVEPVEEAIAETPEGSEEDAVSEEAPADGPLSASVREQGGRSLHRVSRRMRRNRGRGGQGGQGGQGEAPTRGGGEPVGDAPTIAQPEPQRIVTGPEPRSEKAPMPSITELLKEGQEIIVQIAKEPLGQKGARITSHIAMPGRYVVYMPTVDHMGVSRKIGTDEERLRLKRILQTHSAGVPGGYIMRTAGEGKSEEEIAADMKFLHNLWLDMRQKAEKRPAPVLLHHDLDIVQRILRDQLTDNFKAIWVDSEDVYESVLSFVQRFQPALIGKVKMYTRKAPIFDAFNITVELEKALRPKVWLKSGGYIVINQTEALVAIDVNTGKYVGKSNRLEDTIVKTNTEAVNEIVRQVRLRDLGGIIVVDFIDMDERKNRQKVMTVLEEAMRADRAPYKILQFNDFGLVAITRKRVKQSLERSLCSPCPYCEGAGYVKSVQTVINEILQEAVKIASAVDGKDVLLRVHPDVAKVLKSNNNKYLEELEEILRRPVLVKGDPAIHHEKYDLA